MIVVRLLRRFLPCLVVAAIGCVLPGGPARAQVGSDRYSSLVMDARTGEVLSSVSPDDPRYPASLTKVMTLYMLFEALRDRRVTLDELVPVSPHAASMSPSKLGLVPGTTLTVEQALLGLVTKSANDSAAALGELLGGDEDHFADLMTMRAHALGMTHTTFRNASGLPDWDQVTTARDLAVLVKHMLEDFPVQYRYFSVPSFVFHGRTIANHDTMLRTYPGADGLKTGWIESSGHNLLTSAVRGDVRLIGVVLGAGSLGQRDMAMTSILDAGFDHMGVAPVAPALVASRFPSFLGSAHAATLPAYLPSPGPAAGPSAGPVQVASAPLRPRSMVAMHEPARRQAMPADRGAVERPVAYRLAAPSSRAMPVPPPSPSTLARPTRTVTHGGVYYRPAAG